MEVLSLQLYSKSWIDTLPLLMERQESSRRSELVIDMTGNGDAPSSSLSRDRAPDGLDMPQPENRPSSSTRGSMASEFLVSNTRTTTPRRGDVRRRRSPLNSGLWISVELILTVGQIIAAIVVLSFSRHEHPRAPLFAWILGYASGCVATLPLLYWRYRHRNQMLEQDTTLPRQNSQISVPSGSFSLSISRTSEGEEQRPNVASSRNALSAGLTSPRYGILSFSVFLKFQYLHMHGFNMIPRQPVSFN